MAKNNKNKVSGKADKQKSKFLIVFWQVISCFKSFSSSFFSECCKYGELFFFPIGLVLNLVVILVHNVTLSSIFLMLVLIKLLLTLSFKKDTIKIDKASWTFNNTFEDWLLMFFPFISTIYYGDYNLLRLLFLFWLLFITTANKFYLIKSFLKFSKKLFSTTKS